jgi:hypothetical protein
MNYYLDVLKDKDLSYSAKVLFIYLYEMYLNPTAKVKKYGDAVEVDRQKVIKDLDMPESEYEWCYKQLEKYITVKNKPFVIKGEVKQ